MLKFDEVELPEEEFTGPDLGEGVRFGNQCRSLINSEGYKVVTKRMRAITHETFENSPLRDDESRTYCRIVLQVLNDMQILLQDAVDTGTMSAQQLETNAQALRLVPEND